ncbi:MAG TPA: cytochrome c [Methylomirabilota bacterium]|jgi:mono/diheme cytochrome c family protein
MWRRLGIAVLVAAGLVSAPDPSRAQRGAGDLPADGAQLFATSCGFCHQNGGRSAGRGPKLAGTDRPEEYLLNRIRVGKEGAMPAYGRAFTDRQLRALVAYIRSLEDDGQ